MEKGILFSGRFRRTGMVLLALLLVLSAFFAAFPTHADAASSTSVKQVEAAKAALVNAGMLTPVEGIDSDIVTMAQKIVNKATRGVTVRLSSSNHPQISGTKIIYGADDVTGTVAFRLTSKSATGHNTSTVLVPEAMTVKEPVPAPTTIAVTGVTLSKSSGTLEVGASGTLTATVTPSDATNKTVLWTTSDSKVATVTQTGVVTGIGAGTASITATTEDGGYKAVCSVTVTAPAPTTIAVTGVTLSKSSGTLEVGASGTLTATVTPSDATTKTVLWTTSDAKVATVTQTGVVTGIGAGTALITATTEDGGYKAVCTVTVTAAATTSPELSTNAYYVSTAGSDSNPGTQAQPFKTIQKAVSVATSGKTIYIRGGTYKERVVVQNSGISGSPIVIANYPGETVTIDGTGVTVPKGGALVDVSYKKYIKISGLRVVNSAWAGIGSPYGGCSNITIQNCSTYRTQSSGINVSYGVNTVIDGNTVDYANLLPASSGGSDEAITVGRTEGFVISNNVVTNMGKEGIDAKDGANNGKIFNNRIEAPPLMGIYIDGFSRAQYNIEIYNNTITNGRDGVLLAVEYGGSLSNINIHDNYMSNMSRGGICLVGTYTTNAMESLKIVGNKVYGTSGTGSYGILLDNKEAKNVEIRNNIFSGKSTSIGIRNTNGYVASNGYVIDGNALNQIVSGHPTGTNYTVLGNE